ncbi:MAG TPA: glycosyltransferase [Stellaceae bacterium]|nr:glycosyltransferase [Stellaceae bacterium]
MGKESTTRLPWLSVIVPSHNGERWLAAALQSIVDQCEHDIEVILVDSSDTEDSLRIAAQFADKLHLRIFRQPDVLPWTAKTNFGVEQARAEWICMLHQDDLWLPHRCVSLRKWLAAQSDAVMHLHPAYIIDERGKRIGIWRCPLPASETPVPSELLLQRLLVQEFIAIPTPSIRRDDFIRVGGLDDTLQQTADWDLYLKLCQAGNVFYHSEALACFRIHSASQTLSASRNVTDYRKQLESVLARHVGRLNSMSRQWILPLAQASVEINTALASANNGRPAALIKALYFLLRIGPRATWKYIVYSRITERVIPRLRARLAGGL